MCEFLIILHIVSVSVGLTFTPGIGCTTICCALRTQKLLQSLQMNLVFLSFDLGQMSVNISKVARTSLHDNPRRLAIMLRSARHRTSQKKKIIFEGWNFNSGNYLFTTDTK